jgi:hypothetical protein
MKFNTPDSGGIKLITLNPNHKYFDLSGVVQNTKRYSTPLGSLDFSITQARMCDSFGIELARILLHSEHPESTPADRRTNLRLGEGCGKKVEILFGWRPAPNDLKRDRELK